MVYCTIGSDGKVAEWPNVPDSKSGVPQGTVGSNPTLSANKPMNKRLSGRFSFFCTFVCTFDQGLSR
jgi:hypothetical protein